MSTLPVPSKGALRALRHIALGTSCTVAFATGVVTEDRRRRIHSAHEVHENARRIKTSRKYHSAGTSVAATFDEQVMNYGDYGSWKGPAKAGSVTEQPSRTQSSTDQVELQSESGNTTQPSISAAGSVTSRARSGYSISWEPATTSRFEDIARKCPHIKPSVPEVADPQERLARTVERILENGDDKYILSAAVDTMLTGLAAGLDVEFIRQPLEAACVSLFRACQQNAQLETYIPVLERILEYGPIEERLFHELGGEIIVDYLVEQSGFAHSKSTAMRPEHVKRAGAIFLAEYKTKPNNLSSTTYNIGRKLSAASWTSGLFEQTEKVFWRLHSTAKKNLRHPLVHDLLAADWQRGRWEEIEHHFLRFYPHTRPSQTKFYYVVIRVVDCILSSPASAKFESAEKILRKSTEMAASLGLVTSTTWFMRVLHTYWRETGDLEGLTDIYNRLEPLVQKASHPFALYNMMIKLNIRAGKEADAQKYFDKLDQLGHVNVGTCTLLALAKAKVGDWVGVERIFVDMKALLVKDDPEYSNHFTDILNTFIAGHTISETENFMRRFIEKHGITPTKHISDVMIKMYVQAGEFDAITKWLEYVRPLGYQMNSVAVNTLLNTCQRRWNMSFDQLFGIARCAKGSDRQAVDQTTVNILCKAAFVAAKGNLNIAARLRQKAQSLYSPVETPSGQDTADCRVIEEFYAKGEMRKALNAYRNIRGTAHIRSDILAMAVDAAIKMLGESKIDLVVTLIVDAQQRGFDISLAMTPLLVYQMDKLSSNAESVESMVRQTAILLGQHDLSLSPETISKATSILVSRGKFRHAIDLFTSLAQSDVSLWESIDIVMLTVLLKAYVGLADCSGIQLVMKIISKRNIVPDARFKLLLKSACKSNKQRLQSNPGDPNSRRLAPLLDECLAFVLERRSQGMLDQKEAREKALLIMESAAKVRAGIESDHSPRATVVTPARPLQPSMAKPPVDAGRQRRDTKMSAKQAHLWRRPAPEEVYYEESMETMEEQMPRLAAAASG